MTAPAVRRMRLPALEPYTGDDRCPDCLGAKVTGERYEWAANPDTGTVLVLEVLCGICDGCGRDSAHTDCRLSEHGDWHDRSDDPYPDPADPDDGDVCPSCSGRTWWTMQAFNDQQVHSLRVPCGCAEPLMIEEAAS